MDSTDVVWWIEWIDGLRCSAWYASRAQAVERIARLRAEGFEIASLFLAPPVGKGGA